MNPTTRSRILIFLALLLCSQSTFSQTTGIDTVEATTEAAVEIDISSADGLVAGAVGVAAAAAALSPYSQAGIKTSGSLTLAGQMPAPREDLADTTTAFRNIVNPNSAPPVKGFGETEAEAEVESEAEVEVSNGTVAAAGGSGVSASAGGRSIYLTTLGTFALYPVDISLSLDAKTSTSTSLSSVNILYARVIKPGNQQMVDSTDMTAQEPTLETDNDIQSGFLIPYADINTIPLLQTNTEAEVETEAEAEAQAVTGLGAAAAAATGGTAIASAGDFARSDALVSVATSTSTSDVNLSVPPYIQAVSNVSGGNAEVMQTIRHGERTVSSQLRADPLAAQGKGLFESEAEVEVEVEVEADVDNNAAAAAAVASSGAGSNGLAATSRIAASSSVSTSTELDTGAIIRDNSSGTEEYDTYSNFTQNQNDVDASADVQAEAETDPLSSTATGDTATLGDARVAGIILLAGSEQSAQPTIEQRASSDSADDRVAESTYGDRPRVSRSSDPTGNLESEDEAEAEAETMVSIGYNSAAAAAGAAAGQGRNSLLDIPADASAATTTSTSVYDNAESRTQHLHDPGPSSSGDRGGLPPVQFEYSDLNLQKDAEAEAQAKVGFDAAAVAMAASGAGSENLQAVTDYRLGTYFAAAAAGVGTEVTMEFIVPSDGLAGMVWVKVTAVDTTGGPVAVAVAVAGVPTANNIENAARAESEGDSLVSDSVMVFTDPADLAFPKALANDSLEVDTVVDTMGQSTDGFFESEAEAEAEVGAVAGYGVAAASAAASSSGAFATSSSDAKTLTTRPDYVCTSLQGNTWIGGDAGWYDDIANWSQGEFPTICDNVVIPPGNQVTFPSDQQASIYTLFVELGSHLYIPTSATLNVLTVFTSD